MKPFYRICWLILRFYMRVFCRLKIEGAEKVPRRGGVIVAANHISAADPPFIGTCINREFHFLAKKELFRNFFLGFLIRNLNAIPVDRAVLDQSALGAAEEALRRGYGLILFPEGTRSRSGKLGRGKPGVGLLARRTGIPVVPAYIENSRGFGSLLLRGKRLVVRFGEPITTEQLNSFPDVKEGYRDITEEIMTRIGKLAGGEKDGENES
jgi:1-acyl-sn-glycerol-3-phosphate acyltransferase